MKMLVCLGVLLAVVCVKADDTKHPMCFNHAAEVTGDKKSLQTVLEECLDGKKDGTAPEIECCLNKMGLVADDKVDVEKLEKLLPGIALEAHKDKILKAFEECKADVALKAFCECASQKFEGKCDDFGYVGGKKT